MKLILALLVPLAFWSPSSKACSFAHPFEEFLVSSEAEVVPDAPDFEVAEIKRGTDGHHGSCDDAGILTFRNRAGHSGTTGYTFSIVRGAFEGEPFPSYPVITHPQVEDRNRYWFVWLDGLSYEQEPIEIEVEIVGISSSGTKSKTQRILVRHPGRKKKWWQFWK